MIGRRTFLQIAGGCAIAGVAHAQGPDGVKRMGVLFQGSPATAPRLPQQVVDGLRERGWVLGRNLEVEIRPWQRPDQLPGLLEELLRAKVDLISTFNTAATRAAKAATTTIPILFEVGDDPVANGLVTSLSRPGGNLTGFVYGLYDDKLLELLKRAVPKARRVVVPMASASAATRIAANALGIEVVALEVKDPSGLDAFFEALRKARPDGVVVPNVQWMNVQAKSFAEGLRKASLPGIAWSEEFARAGGLLSYHATSMFKQRLVMVDALLRGANPRDIPVQMPTEFRLFVNLAAAKALGVTIPQELLLLVREEDVIGRDGK